MQENLDWLDELLDNDPIIWDTNWSYCCYIESKIMTSNLTHHEQSEYLNKLQTIKKSEADKLLIWLEDNQIYKDPREQFKLMCKNGVFN